jgi:hypothetical protein
LNEAGRFIEVGSIRLKLLSSSAQARDSNEEMLTLLRQHQVWARFEEKLDAKDRVPLDRMCVGDDVKVAAAIAKLEYDCANKRIARYRTKLNFRTNAQLLAMWHRMHAHAPHINDETPTLIRHADKLAALRSDDVGS